MVHTLYILYSLYDIVRDIWPGPKLFATVCGYSRAKEKDEF